jgi:putative endonuclease
MRQYFVYIMTNGGGALFVGMTNDLMLRVHQHKKKPVEGHAAKNEMTMLVYYEATGDIAAAMSREKQLKRWNDHQKVALVDSSNPQWSDLSAQW